MVRNGPLTERSVVTANNFLPVGRKLFVYQAAEYNLVEPAGMAKRGLAYFMTNARVTPHDRLELQANYNRGRSIDARGLGDDVPERASHLADGGRWPALRVDWRARDR